MSIELRKKLEQIKLLLDSNAISLEEYNDLKEEILFGKNNHLRNNKSNVMELNDGVNKFNKDDKEKIKIDSKRNKENENGSLKIVFSIIAGILILGYLMFKNSPDENEIISKCPDCNKFEKIRKTNWILVSRKDKKSNVYDTDTNRFLLNNWYEAEYDEGAIFDDITFIVNGSRKMCSKSNYKNLSELGDEFLLNSYETNSSDTNSGTTYESSGLSSTKKCSWCGSSFNGSHYTHLGKLAPCQSSTDNNSIGVYCSMKCCSEARRSSCPTCQ